MGVTYSSGQATLNSGLPVNVTVTPFVPQPTSSQTPVTVLTTSNGSTKSIYTVTTGKTLYIYGIECAGTTITSCDWYQNDGSTRFAKITKAAGTSTMAINNSTPLAVFTTAQVVKIDCDGSGAYVGFWGIEV